VGWVHVRDDAHHRRGTGQGLDSTFNPVNGCILDAVLGKNGENGGIGVAAGDLLGGVRMNRDPQDNLFVEDILAVLIGGGEADRQHRGDTNATSLILEQRNDLQSNGLLPKLVLEDRVDDSMSGLLGDGGEPASRDEEGTLQEIGTVEEGRKVVRDAGVEVDMLKERD